MIKIEAATRLIASWFDDLDEAEKKDYIRKHPNSKYAADHDALHDEDKPEHGDKERLSELKSQISDMQDDIREIEADGDDAGPERKHLQKLQHELSTLK
jgi:dGTP triphosphohydrolase